MDVCYDWHMYIAVDIGGTNIRVAFSTDVTDISSNIKRHTNVPITNDYNTDLANLLKAILAIHDHEQHKLSGVAVGLPGVIDQNGTIVVGANIHGWVGHKLETDLEQALGCKVFIENDDTIAAYGEAKFGFGKDKDFIYHTWGTGFGGAKVEQTSGNTNVRQFEAGHHIIEWNNGRLCGCGQTGCAEAYIGGGNIQKYYGKPANELSEQEWDTVLEHLAQTLLNTLMFNPASLIILGGGIAINQKDRVSVIKEKLQRRLTVYPMPQVEITEHGDDLGLFGAFALLNEKLGANSN